jgi:hypothetical protein
MDHGRWKHQTIKNIVCPLPVAVFSAEYNYWKRFMPELMELYAQCHRKFQIVEIQLLRIFYHLLVDDFSFLACAHSHLEHKEFTQLIHIIVDITREKEVNNEL